jgi:hypothetical protein
MFSQKNLSWLSYGLLFYSFLILVNLISIWVIVPILWVWLLIFSHLLIINQEILFVQLDFLPWLSLWSLIFFPISTDQIFDFDQINKRFPSRSWQGEFFPLDMILYFPGPRLSVRKDSLNNTLFCRSHKYKNRMY